MFLCQFSFLQIDSSNFDEIQELTKALQFLDELEPWMKKLRQFLMRSILSPLINMEASVGVADGDAFSTMEVVVKLQSRKPDYFSVLENLTLVMSWSFKLFNEISISTLNTLLPVDFIFTHSLKHIFLFF